ncbi:hypothetical protein NA56DRAFT_708432 [Hyaloscypha hepaticicola]|uniref:Uncharacterized protein n=1 Tax=Hyaloscypha hepaticicola TaxID=2082293 RepID=A0A2J6PS44_9HELO|nr:hypothetical protein NA56DRAFT_708432 [Hyaloscypha hepaticicola]
MGGEEHCGSCGRRGAVGAAAGVASLLEASERSTDKKIAGRDGLWVVCVRETWLNVVYDELTGVLAVYAALGYRAVVDPCSLSMFAVIEDRQSHVSFPPWLSPKACIDYIVQVTSTIIQCLSLRGTIIRWIELVSRRKEQSIDNMLCPSKAILCSNS